MNSGTQLFIPITSSPFGANLAAMGVATWLEDLGQKVTGQKISVWIANAGHSLCISTPATITPEQVQPHHYAQPPVWIRTAKGGKPPVGANALDYEANRQRSSAYFEKLAQLRKARVNLRNPPQEICDELTSLKPQAEWPIATAVNQMGALNAYNKAIERWLACKACYVDVVAIIWTMCSGKSHALDTAAEQWQALAKQHKDLEKKPALSAMQLVNPEQGKGANRSKADALTIGGQEGFWLLEYFKFAGLFKAALPRTVQGRKDRKTYVVMPSHGGIEYYWHKGIFQTFQDDFWASSAIKMDIQAALRYTTAMLTQWEAAELSGGRRRKASDYIDGFAVASFKDLGSAVAVMNVATLRLPDWVEWPQSAQQAQKIKEVIEHHQLLIGALDESYSEEEHLLRAYRDFLSSRDPALTAFFDFTNGYASHVMRKMSRRQSVRRLTTENLEEIVMAQEQQREKPLKVIVENEGFRNIAKAIRQSTVVPQFQKVTGDTPYDVRYGLADDLRRKSRSTREFVAALSEFMQQYNKENKRVYARNPGAVRADITTSDIEQFVALLDEYDTAMVANLLIAFGYARVKKDDKDDAANNAQPGSAGDQDTDMDETEPTDESQGDKKDPF